MRHPKILVSLGLLGSLAACTGRAPTGAHGPGLVVGGGAVEVGPVDADRVVAGQTVYVPAYSSVYTSDGAQSFDLAVTLTVRNTDRGHPIVVSRVTYHAQDGRPVREYLKAPIRVGPMASVNFLVAESDTRGGSSSCFLAEWVAERKVSEPVVESVMVGVSGQQGISFTSAGRVIEDRSRPAPPERTNSNDAP